MSKHNFSTVSVTDQPFVIGEGYCYAESRHMRWWTNQALANINGTLTNEKLMAMSDEQLKKVAYTEDGVARTERYRRPADKFTAERQGGYPGEEVVGTHRAKLILDFRRDQERFLWEKTATEEEKEAASAKASKILQAIRELFYGGKHQMKKATREFEYCPIRKGYFNQHGEERA